MIPNEDLAAWLAGEADPAVAEQVEAAMAADPEVEARVESIRRVDALLADLPAVTPDADAVARISASAQRAASDVLDLEAARTAEATAGHRRGDANGTWLSTWSMRLAAAAGVVALAVVGFTLERGGMMAFRESDEASVGSITADGGTGEVPASATSESMADDGAAGGGDAVEDAAAANEPMASAPAMEEQGSPRDGEAEFDVGEDMATLAGQVDAAAWDAVVAGLVPTMITTAAGDVLAVDAGPRLQAFAMAAATDGDQSDLMLYSVPTVMTSREIVQSWLDEVGPLATSDWVVGGGEEASTATVDDVASCLAARSEAVDDGVPAVVGAVVGRVGVDATPAIGLVDESGGIVVVDAATCLPLGQ